MGIYNPNLPKILGQEFVPIRDENLVFTGVTNNVERGYSFHTTASRTLTEGRFYVNELPSAFAAAHVYTMGIYPKGQEDKSGPVRSVIIPCNAGSVTGNATLTGPNVQRAMLDPSDLNYITVNFNSGIASTVSLYFAVNAYSALLSDKRILGVNLLYAADQLNAGDLNDTQAQTCSFRPYVRTNAVQGVWSYPNLFAGTSVATSLNEGSPFQANVINRIAIGDTNMFDNLTGVDVTVCRPWRYTDLQRFESGAANQLYVFLTSVLPFTSNAAPSWALDYMAMEVIFCEEKRVAVGSAMFNYTFTGLPFNLGANVISIRNLDGTAGPILDSDADYVVTLSRSNTGDQTLTNGATSSSVVLGPEASINAIRQYYTLSSHEAIQLNMPSPPTPEVDGQVFTSEEVEIMPQMSLHTAAGTMVEPQVYGRQAVGQVYGTPSTSQRILDSGMGSSATFPWVRFYARRFGHTNVELKLECFALPSSTVTISADEFDELPEIIDGWKEVTLRFDTPPTLGTGTNPTWEWSAKTESSGNRWEVLGAVAPALSGMPTNLLNLATTQLGIATYGQAASGSAIQMSWMNGYAPLVSTPTGDPSSDAVLLFAQELPAITGFTVTSPTQSMVGIGLNCGLDPAFIPTGITYNQLTWGSVDRVTTDDFNRTVANGWGTASGGGAWTILQGTPVSGFSVDGSVGRQTHQSASVNHEIAIDVGNVDQDATIFFKVPSTPTGTNAIVDLRLRAQVGGDGVFCRVDMNSSADMRFTIFTAGDSVHRALEATHWYGIRMSAIGPVLRAKFWDATAEAEPDWQLSGYDLTSATRTSTLVSVFSFANVTSLPYAFRFDNFSASATPQGLEKIELQRMDPLTDWQTIMLATTAVTAFNDYEARIGDLSSYRIRMVAPYNFPGVWSSTVTSTLASPGVSGTSLDSTSHILAFTTNSRQDGSSNLAYALGWDGEIAEDFSFPEAAGQQIQAMYGRDFVTVFRPEERGGTNFSRTLLVQAAAIADPTLEDFTSLRDMAWDDVPYIAVRDEQGNRWFASVSVPSGRVQRNRRLYLAPINIIQVTDTPTPVDP